MGIITISSVQNKNGDATVIINGELIASSADKLVDALETLDHGKSVFLDMAGVTFMDSSGLRTCIQLQNNLQKGGGKLTCCNLTPQVKKVFKVTGADGKILLVSNKN